MNTNMSLHDFHAIHNQLKTGEIILDVRNPDEFASGHIPKATNIPLPQLGERLDELKDHSKIYIHCKRGGRAKTALELMANAGFTNLVCVNDAGMDLWIESGYEVVK